MRYLLALLAALTLPASASANCSGRFAALARYAGGTPEQFLESPPVKARMQALLGPSVSVFREDLDVSGPVALIDCELVVDGNAAHQGGERNAIFSFSLYDGSATAGILAGGRVTILTESAAATSPDHYEYLPAFIRDWAVIASGGFASRGTPPSNVTVAMPPTGSKR